MPHAPHRLCPRGHIIVGRGPCPICRGVQERRRATPTERGYDADWIRVRDRYRAEHPLCELCLARGRIRPMLDVDHIIPFEGPGDPLRLAVSNLQSLCGPCHQAKSKIDHARARAPRRGPGGEGG